VVGEASSGTSRNPHEPLTVEGIAHKVVEVAPSLRWATVEIVKTSAKTLLGPQAHWHGQPPVRRQTNSDPPTAAKISKPELSSRKSDFFRWPAGSAAATHI
jgi:hypothetical protein